MNRLSRLFVLEAVALSPVHIGASPEERWQRDWDFVPAPEGGPLLYRLDLGRLLALAPEEALLRGRDDPPVRWVEPRRWAEARLSTHRLHGSEVPGEVLPLIRDARGIPYLPGSTLKGALRTALLRARMGNTPVGPQDLGRDRQERPRPQVAGQAVEERFLRPVPPERRPRGTTGANYDVMRIPRLGDAYPEKVETEVVPVVWAGPGDREGRPLAWLEVFPPGLRFRFSLRLDRRLAEEEGPREPQLRGHPLQGGLSWPDWVSRLGDLAPWAEACRAWSREVLEEQRRLASALGEPLRRQVLDGLDRVDREGKALGERGFLLPVGWGTGWHAKTVGGRVTDAAARAVGVRRPRGLRLALREDSFEVLGWLAVRPRPTEGARQRVAGQEG